MGFFQTMFHKLEVSSLVATVKNPGPKALAIGRQRAEAVVREGYPGADQAAVDRLAQMGAQVAAREVRGAAFDRLVAIGPAAVEPLLRLVKEALLEYEKGFTHDAFDRSHGGRSALVRIGKPAVLLLIATLRDRHHAVREMAASALGEIADSAAVEPLFVAVADEAESVRREAAGALRRITKQDLGQDRAKWQEWWQKKCGRDLQRSESSVPPQQVRPSGGGSTDQRILRLFHDSVEKGDLAKVAELLTSNPTLANALEDELGRRTALHKAAMTGARRDMVAFLIQHGGNVAAGDKPGWTPLHWAAFLGHSETVEALLAAGADVNSKSNMLVLTGRLNNINVSLPAGTTPLHAAVRGVGNRDIVQSLIQKGADITAKDEEGNTPLELATRGAKTEAAELLAKKAAEARPRATAGHATTTIVQCPGCGRKLRADNKLIGKRVKCPKCSHVILVGETSQGQTAPPTSQPVPAQQEPIVAEAVPERVASPDERVLVEAAYAGRDQLVHGTPGQTHEPCEHEWGEWEAHEYYFRWRKERTCRHCGKTGRLCERCDYKKVRLEGDSVYQVCDFCGSEKRWEPQITGSQRPGYKVFTPDYTGLNESYISAKDRALEIPNDCVVLPEDVFQCPACGQFFSAAASSPAL
jgi:ankyrin repeat protein